MLNDLKQCTRRVAHVWKKKTSRKGHCHDQQRSGIERNALLADRALDNRIKNHEMRSTASVDDHRSEASLIGCVFYSVCLAFFVDEFVRSTDGQSTHIFKISCFLSF